MRSEALSRGTITQKITDNKGLFYLVAFVLPFIIMLIAYVANNVYPAGERGVALVDSFHQYVPFMSDFQDKLKTGGSLMYSWNGGLGYNFFANMTYYLMSPINLFLAIIPKSQILTFFSLAVMAKISFASVTFSFYMSRKMGRRSCRIIVFALFYAFCGWSLGYNWNIMWLDCFALLPLIVYGLEKLIDKGKGTQYAIFLGTSVICNYYISIAICIFLILYFFYYYFSVKRSGTVNFLKRGVQTLLYSILGVGMGAVCLIPAYMALQTTSSASIKFPMVIRFYHSFLDIISQMFTANVPTKVSGLPNLYSGAIVFMCIILFILSKRIRLRRKVLTLVLLGILIFSTNFRMLDYIWHGFHFPNDLPARFTFMFSFVALAVSCEIFMNIKRFTIKAYKIAGFVPVILCIICGIFAKENEAPWAFAVTGGLLLIYMLLLIGSKAENGRSFIKALIILLAAEAAANTVMGISCNGTMNRTQYVAEIDDADKVNAITAAEDTGFYRTEMYKNNARNNAMFLGFRSHSLFSSTLNLDLQKLMKNLGFFSTTNKFTYIGATPVTDSVFGIKYLFAGEGKKPPRSFVYKEQAGEHELFVNPYALSIGFMVNESYLDWSSSGSDPLVVQNGMAKAMSGISENIFTPRDIDMGASEGVNCVRSGGSDYSIKRTDGKEHYVEWIFTNTTGKDAYAYFNGKDCSKLEIISGASSEDHTDLRGYIIELGKGEEVHIKATLESDKDEAKVTLIPYVFNEDAFNMFYSALSLEQLVVSEFTDTYIKGEINASNSAVMATSLVYDKGWKIYVDGEETEILGGDKAFAHIRINEGKHIIEMKYSTPGLKTGLLGSILCFVFIIILFLLQNFFEKRSKYKKDFTNNS